MRTSLPLIVVLILCGNMAMAQVPPASPEPAVLQRCLLNTPLETWTNLQLSPDQLRRMGFVQEACAEECEAAGVRKDPNAISNADGSTVLAEVRNILTEEQYAAWVALCASGKVGAPK